MIITKDTTASQIRADVDVVRDRLREALTADWIDVEYVGRLTNRLAHEQEAY